MGAAWGSTWPWARETRPARSAWPSFACPLATFYAITSFFLDQTLGVFLVAGTAYGFATAAMLVPAICEFDVATGQDDARGIDPCGSAGAYLR